MTMMHWETIDYFTNRPYFFSYFEVILRLINKNRKYFVVYIFTKLITYNLIQLQFYMILKTLVEDKLP